MPYYTGLSGRVYKTSNQLGVGGEGYVMSIEGNNKQVIKLYKNTKFKNTIERQSMERKLRVMISMNVPIFHNGNICLAWPQDIVYENGIMVGFVMPKITTKYKIYDIYRGGDNSVRERLYPNYTWKYSVQFAHNLAWIVDHLHSMNIVIGDFNQNNVAVDPTTSTIILIDCDSFDITDPTTGEHFPCCVGLPEMLAPELQKVGSLINGRFTKESDNFSLAIHIFRLLMENADPFGGVITVSGAPSVSESDANQAIINGECVYVRNIHGKEIPKWSPKIDVLPRDVIALFNKTFNYTAITAMIQRFSRATAGEWVHTLAPYGAADPNRLLKHCRKNRHHVYAKHNTRCPWCEISIRLGTTKKESVWPKVAVVAVLLLVLLFSISYFGEDIMNVATSWLNANQSHMIHTPEVTTEPIIEEYIIPNSDSTYLSEEDLEGLSEIELCLARNEIFARHGRIFTTEWIREYFLNTTWYVEMYSPEEFDNSINDFFNEYEHKNVEMILAYEEKMGYR